MSTTAAPLRREALPPVDRPEATLATLDITKWFGETSGGVKSYLDEKARYVAARPALCHVLTSLRANTRWLGDMGARTLGHRARTRLVHGYVRALARRFRAVIVASDYAGDELRQAGVERVVRIPLGVDLTRFHPAHRIQRDLTRIRYGLPTDRPLAVYVGRLAPEKRLDVVLDAWPEVEFSPSRREAWSSSWPAPAAGRSTPRGHRRSWHHASRRWWGAGWSR